jgi:hypothetical protein
MYKSYIIDVPANEIAVAGSLAPFTDTIVQLVAGGDAVASFPVLDGTPFKLELAGTVYIQSGVTKNTF